MPPNYNNSLNPKILSTTNSQLAADSASVWHRLIHFLRQIVGTLFKYVILPWLLSQIGVVWYFQILIFLSVSIFRLVILILNPPQILIKLIHTLFQRDIKNHKDDSTVLYSNEEVEHQLLLKQREFDRVTFLQRLQLLYYRLGHQSRLAKHFKREWETLMTINNEMLEVLGLLPVKANYIFDRYILHSPFCVINKLSIIDMGLKGGYKFRGIHLTKHDGFKEYVRLKKETYAMENVSITSTVSGLGLPFRPLINDLRLTDNAVQKLPKTTSMVPAKRTTSNPIELLKLAQPMTTTTHSQRSALQTRELTSNVLPTSLKIPQPQSFFQALPTVCNSDFESRRKARAISLPPIKVSELDRPVINEEKPTVVKHTPPQSHPSVVANTTSSSRNVDIEIIQGSKRNRFRLKLTPKKQTNPPSELEDTKSSQQFSKDAATLNTKTSMLPESIIKSIAIHETAYVEQVIQAIQKVIPKPDYDDGSLGPILLRLAWHCCATYDKYSNTGGSNGATMRFVPEITDEGNTGLDIARGALEPVKHQFPRITYSDLWTLAGKVAIEFMGGPIIPWQCGRIDCKDDRVVPPNGRLPFGYKDASHVRDTFSRMGFNDQEAVLLMGCHGLGRCHKRYSGWEGKWTIEPTRFSNDFFKVLLQEQWTLGEVPETGKQQYFNADRSLMMLNTDMELVRDPHFAKWVGKYASDEKLFFTDFALAFGKLLELGIIRDPSGEILLYN